MESLACIILLLFVGYLLVQDNIASMFPSTVILIWVLDLGGRRKKRTAR
jgi:hypothetical protein